MNRRAALFALVLAAALPLSRGLAQNEEPDPASEPAVDAPVPADAPAPAEPAAPAPTPAPEPPPPPMAGPVEQVTLQEFLAKGGVVAKALVGLSVVGLALTFYLALTLRTAAVIPEPFTRDLLHRLHNRQWEACRELCRNHRSPVAALAGAALDFAQRTGRHDPAPIREVLEGEGGRQATRLQNRTQYLLDIGVVAPMIGLLGTVLGMLKAFNVVAGGELAQVRPVQLAGGVSEALITTALGLFIAIPAMAAYAWFRNRTADHVAALESVAAEVLSSFTPASDPEAGKDAPA